MDSPDVGSREDMIESGKRRKILDASEFSKDKDRATEHVEDWVDTGDRKHRASKSRKSGKGEREPRAGRGRGYGGGDERVDGNGEYSEDERAGGGGKKKADKLDTSWDIPEEGRSKRKSSKDKRVAKLEKISVGESCGKEESGDKDDRGWVPVKEGRDESERSDREAGHAEGLGTRSSGSSKKRVGGKWAGKVGDGTDVEEEERKGGRNFHEESEEDRGRRYERDDDESRALKVDGVGGGRSRSRSRGERGHEAVRELSADKAAVYEDSEDGRLLEKRRNGREKIRGGKTDREEASERFQGDDDDRFVGAWDEVEDKRNSGRTSDKVEERGGKRGVRDRGRGERNELFKEEGPEPFKERERNKGAERIDSKWDESEEGYAGGRSKRSREDDRRDRSRGKERGDAVQDDYEDGSKVSVRVREDSRADRQQLRSERADDWVELESGTRSNGRKKLDRVVDDRLDRVRARDRVEAGREEIEDGRRGRGEKVDEDWGDKVVGSGRELSPEAAEELGRFNGKPKGEREAERSDKHREKLLRDRAEGIREASEDGGRLLARARGDDERGDKLKARERADGGREESDDGGRSGGRSRSVKNWKDSWSPDVKRGGRGDWDDGERDWLDEKEELERERPSGRRDREKDRDRYIEREGVHDKDYDDSWERSRRREWEEVSDRRKDRPRERYKDRDEKGRERESEQDIDRESWEMDRRRERVERERSGRERFEREMNERDRVERERGEGLTSPNAVGMLGDVIGRGGSGIPLPPSVDHGRGILASGPFMPRVGDNGMLQGDYLMGSGDGDWEAPMPDERLRIGDGGYLHDGRDRFTNEDEPPPGLDQGFGPSPGRGGGNDGGMGFNLHRGNGRAKGSSSNRGRGQVVMHEGRPIFINNQGGGLMMRNMQQGVKGGRGGRGPGKGGRGGGVRDNQRGNVTVISQMGPGPGPGLPGPHFGPLGPPGPMPGLGPGMMGPGGFQMSPFGGPMGWGGNRGGGDIGMMNGPPGPGPGPGPGPPRFGPGMGPGGPPGPGPNMFFTPPGPGRGGPGAIVPGGMFGGGSPFGGRPMPGDRGPPGGRGAARGGGPGRGPSRGEQNDYSQHFVDTGLRPQNFIRDVELADRFEEYPKLKELISRKDKLIADRATPPMYMQCDLRTTELRPEVFGTKFDVILVDPPWEEYVRRAPGVGDSMEWWSYEDIQNLRIEAISDTPAFIFLWVGDAEGLDQGRLCLKKWGFRRCEDICWVKTNRENPTPALRHDANTLLQHSKEHCLMGIKGTVRRSTDGHIIHANVDTDIIISEEPDYGATAKPEELYHIIEHFAQGQRRLELFGEDHNIRAGWVTVGKGLSSSNFNPQMYAKHFVDAEGKVWQGGRGNPPVDAPHLVGTTPEIESLRPKSPPPRAQQQPPSQAANSAPQTAGGNSNNKKPPSTSQMGSQNGPSVSIPVSGQGHGLHSQPSSVGGTSRGGGGHVQPKRQNTAVQGSKPYLITACSGVENVAVSGEPSSGPELVEVSGEREGGGIGDHSKTLSS